MSRVAGPAALFSAALVLALAAPASAYWGGAGAGAGAGATGTLAAPTGVSVPVNSLSGVAVTWTASGGSPAPTGYYVTRTSGATTVAACASSATTLLSSTACTDSGVPDGAYVYRVTAKYRSWTTTGLSGGVSVWTPAKLAVTGQPGTTVSGTAITPAVAVTVQNAAGVAVPLPGTSISVAIGTNPGSGTLSGTATATTNAAGVATFSGLSINKAGVGYTLVAASSGLTSATSAAFTVTAGPAAKLVITSGSIAGVASEVAAGGPVVVQVRDAADNPVTTGLVVSLSSNSAGTAIFSGALNGAVNSPTMTIAAGSSSGTFYYGDTKATPAGTVTVTAAATGLTSGTLAGAVTPAADAKLQFVQQPTNAVRRTIITPAITVRILDRFGNSTASTAVVTIAIENNPPAILGLLGGTLSGHLTPSGVAGLATFGDLEIGGGLLGLAGNGNGYTLKVTSGTLTASISNPFNIS